MGRKNIVLSAFPRSANTFVFGLLKQCFPSIQLDWTHNTYGLKCFNAITIIRQPDECIASWITYTPKKNETYMERLPKVVAWYNRFYINILQSKAIIYDFTTITQNPNLLIKDIEKRFDLKSNLIEINKLDKGANIVKYKKLNYDVEGLQTSFELFNKAFKKRVLLNNLII